jgi:ion channel-forming bestrophin family protein
MVCVIVKRNLSPAKVWSYVWLPISYATAVAVSVVVAQRIGEPTDFEIPFAPVGTIGAAVAIFVAFRNNVSYARWWEARTLWGNIQNNSRILARQLVASTDNAIAAGTGGTAEEVLRYRNELVLHIIAVAHSLRIELRETGDWESLRSLLPDEEFSQLLRVSNRPNFLLQRLGIRIKDGVRNGIVGQFDPITLEPNLAALNGWVAGCERIKHTPTPRQYDYFTRVSVGVFSTILPFGLASVVTHNKAVWIVVLSVLLSAVFVVLERVGSVVDAPFANLITDVPMTSITTAIERDLREQVGDTELPLATPVVDGYLW